MTRWNVPGNARYIADLPLDIILSSIRDAFLRGYWLGRDVDGQLCFVSNQNNADYVHIDTDIDGVPVIVYDTDLTEELSFDGILTLTIKRYS